MMHQSDKSIDTRIQDILDQYFSEIDSLRDIQKTSIEHIVEGTNCLCLMPTGGGKSLIYQVSGLLLGKITVVISPLVALMEQQSKKLDRKGLRTRLLHGGIDLIKQYSIIRELAEETSPSFLFISPERAAFEGYLQYILKQYIYQIGLIVIDEAHCISQWGNSFRPAYKMLPWFLKKLSFPPDGPRLLCLSATINPQDLDEIKTDFNIHSDNVYKSKYLLRSNLTLSHFKFEKEIDKKAKLEKLLSRHDGEKIIVYVHRKSSQYGTQKLAEEYKDQGYLCDYFDADRLEEDKSRVLEQFENGQIKIVFATNAFGMGIDIPDIRVVIHFLIPDSIEQYYQEVGRAGRDGLPAFGYLFFSDKNIDIKREQISKSCIKPEDFLKVYEEKFAFKKTSLYKTFDVWDDRSERYNELLVFYYLTRLSILDYVVSGLSTIDSFSRVKKVPLAEFEAYKEMTTNGLLISLSKKTGVALEDLINKFFGWFTQGSIKLTSAPSKVSFYSLLQELTEQTVEQITEDLKRKVDYRLNNLDKLAQMIKSDERPEIAICKHLACIIHEK